MIALPPGCRVNYSVWIDVRSLSTEIVEWYELVGGNIKEADHWDTRGRKQTTKFVSYGKGKWCHHHQNGAGGTRLHFLGEDASVASMFILKFMDIIDSHNLKEVDNLAY
jgi:hypothetical protein